MKKLVAIIAIIAMAFTGCTTGCNKENEVINETPENPEVVSNEVENQGAKEYRVTDETVNAYDFIIETMSKPQYYSDEQYVEGQISWDEEKIAAFYDTRGVDRTAWVLIDEETSTFQRAGYENVLTLSFSNYTAVWSHGIFFARSDGYDYATEPMNILNGERAKCYAEIYDFKNNKFYCVDERDDAKQDLVVSPKTGTNSDIELIRRCFDEYKELFEKAGCPIVGEPKGTLAKYKNKEIKKLEEVDDGLIHAIWEQDGFEWKWVHNTEGTSIASWTDSPDIVWLDDYRDIQYAKAPESDYRDVFNLTCFDGSVLHLESAPYSPVFLVFADKGDNNDRYANSAEFFALYYLTPLMQEIYGYNAVYFTDRTKAPNGVHDTVGVESRAEFERGAIRTDQCEIATILNQGTEYVSCKYSLNGVPMLGSEVERDRFVGLMKDICDYYGKEYIFGDDYFDNFMTIFDSGARKLLGLC